MTDWLTSWFRNFTWAPFVGAYVIPMVLGVTTWLNVRGPSTGAGPLLMGPWVDLILAQVLLLIIGVAVINERQPDRFAMALLHAILGFALCPVSVVLTLLLLGYHS